MPGKPKAQPIILYPELVKRLRVRYPAPEYAFFEEVRNSTGFTGSRTRTADAVAMGLYPSRGLMLEGLEFKAYRSDWLRELKAPDKGEGVLGYCDLVWVVTCSRGVARADELPPLWGLIEPHGKGLRAVKAARPNPERREMTRGFLASLLRKAHAWLEHELENSDRTVAARKAGMEVGARNNRFEVDQAKNELERLRGMVSRFENESGVEIQETWTGGDIGAAVRLVRQGGVNSLVSRLQGLRDQLVKALELFEAGS